MFTHGSRSEWMRNTMIKKKSWAPNGNPTESSPFMCSPTRMVYDSRTLSKKHKTFATRAAERMFAAATHRPPTQARVYGRRKRIKARRQRIIKIIFCLARRFRECRASLKILFRWKMFHLIREEWRYSGWHAPKPFRWYFKSPKRHGKRIFTAKSN